VNKDNIFNLFEENSGDEIQGISGVTIEEFLDDPKTKIGMFTKLISNHHVFHIKLKKFFEQEGAEFDLDKAKQASSFTVHHRAWFYINQIEVDKDSHIKAIKEFEPTILSKSLNSAIRYYEDREEYEKCADLLKVKKLVKKV